MHCIDAISAAEDASHAACLRLHVCHANALYCVAAADASLCATGEGLGLDLKISPSYTAYSYVG